jgi:hypothetical protein
MSENLAAMDLPKLRCKWETGALARVLCVFSVIVLFGGCTFGNTDESLSYTADRGVGNQPYPQNYRPELLSFLKTYLNDPTGVHAAQIAEPVQRPVGGRTRYVTCLRYSNKEFNGSYTPVKDRAVVYIDGRLDRLIEQPGDVCAGATYAAFPELEKLTR